MVELICVSVGLLAALGESFAEYVVSQYSFTETCVAWKGLLQPYILFSLLLNHLGVSPRILLIGNWLPELFGFSDCELIDFWSSGLAQLWLMDLDFFIRDANNISGSSPKHLRRRDVDFSLSTHVLFARLQVLSSHIVVVVDVVGDFTECVGMEIFRFYGMDVGCVSWVRDELPGIWDVPYFFSRGTVLS